MPSLAEVVGQDHTAYRISAARYAKGKVVVHPKSDGTGFKTRASRLADAIGGRWVHRNHGYQMSPSQAKRFIASYAAGWDAEILSLNLIPPAVVAGSTLAD